MKPTDLQREEALDYLNDVKRIRAREGDEILDTSKHSLIYVPDLILSTKFIKIIEPYIYTSVVDNMQGGKLNVVRIKNFEVISDRKLDSRAEQIKKEWEPIEVRIGDFETHETLDDTLTKLSLKAVYKTDRTTYSSYQAYSRPKLEDYTGSDTFDTFKGLYEFINL